MHKNSVPVSVPTPDPIPISDPVPLTSTNSSTTPNISLLSATTFQKAMHSKGAQCFSDFIQNPNEATGCCATLASKSDLEGVPNIYRHFSDVFSKGSANSLPPHREYDLKINIKETAKALLGPVYPLSQSELGALHEFIDEHLNMGFICPSNSPFGVPVLFIKKKDGSLWLCVNFHQLNSITQKDKYPLPLVSDLLEAPSKVNFFTKIDLWHAYHLIWISSSDKWKMAFCTCYGSFEWLVMPFRLTNAPASFQHFLNTIFLIF